jgi:thioredoxin-like negative regulator of GroEL
MRVAHNISSIAEFEGLLRANPGILIIKVGAEWCAPCRSITPYIMARLAILPAEQFTAVAVDADASPEFYAYMKRKRMLPGIPALFAYIKGNTTFVPDFQVIGSDQSGIDELFQQCMEEVSP